MIADAVGAVEAKDIGQISIIDFGGGSVASVSGLARCLPALALNSSSIL